MHTGVGMRATRHKSCIFAMANFTHGIFVLCVEKIRGLDVGRMEGVGNLDRGHSSSRRKFIITSHKTEKDLFY